MSVPEHIDVAELERRLRETLKAAEAEPNQPSGVLMPFVRAVEVRVSLTVFCRSELNRGTPPEEIFQAIGGALAECVSNLVEPESVPSALFIIGDTAAMNAANPEHSSHRVPLPTEPGGHA